MTGTITYDVGQVTDFFPDDPLNGVYTLKDLAWKGPGATALGVIVVNARGILDALPAAGESQP